MFNSKYKKEAIENFNKHMEIYKEKWNETIRASERLHNIRMSAFKLIKNAESYIESVSNKPEELIEFVEMISINRRIFQDDIEKLENSNNESSKKYGGLDEEKIYESEMYGAGVAGAGVAAGIGVATLGPSAAMAIATTFGTASTGIAISGISGAAATNAALAWLGGGALAAGGGGMAAGNALLALAGPIGWAIGGSALLGGGLLANSKNKKVAEEAEEKTIELKKIINKLSKICKKVNDMCELTEELKLNLMFNLGVNTGYDCLDYNEMNNGQKNNYKNLTISTMDLSEKIIEKVDYDPEKCSR